VDDQHFVDDNFVEVLKIKDSFDDMSKLKLRF
jgi:hypothetical protein